MTTNEGSISGPYTKAELEEYLREKETQEWVENQKRIKKYHALKLILDGAYNQASEGKGRERHADGEPFEKQKICTIARWVKGSPAAGPLQQVIKKAAESARLSPEKAIHELYGVINYAAAAIIILEEEKGNEKNSDSVILGERYVDCGLCDCPSDAKSAAGSDYHGPVDGPGEG